MFQPVPTQINFAEQERTILKFWKDTGAFERLRQLRANSDKRFSFIDGPITANNPMGVHHAWGRTYKDLWQRYKVMQGNNTRWQNGFDCQGLWVEVNVEKDLGFKSKRDIETYGMQKFINLCKQRVLNSAAQQTEQTIRLGNWMDWNDPDELRDLAKKLAADPEQHITLKRGAKEIHGTVEQLIGKLGMEELQGSYFTFSDENNYQIWGFLKKCFERGWVYRGGDVIPWCPRCATGISQHEIDTEGYKDRIDPAITVRMRLKGLNGLLVDSFDENHQSTNQSINQSTNQLINWASDAARDAFVATKNKYILAWTTTPWTLPANVMCAVGPKLTYAMVQQHHSDGEMAVYFLSNQTLKMLKGDYEVLGEIKGEAMDGWTYEGIFDDLPVWEAALKEWKIKNEKLTKANDASFSTYAHRIILWNDVGEAEGTGIVHNAPGCGPEDYKLGKEHNTPAVAPLDDEGHFVAGFNQFSGKFGHDVPDLVEQALKQKGFLYRRDKYNHRYPHCWRCGTPLLYRQVNEWYISMDTLRHDMMRETNKINWIPSFGKEREIDWLHNMHDWMISKKRYWGLALPIWEYPDGSFEVIGSREELKARAIEGWDEFDGHTPHRPHIDKVRIKHPVTGLIGTRVPDVGNPWLDAGIVTVSTLRYSSDQDYWRKWFPADFITESFPGQFRNWFYSLIAMSTVLTDSLPAKTILGFATLFDEKGKPMHKSSGNAIEFNEAADKAGADTMRWVYARQRYDDNLLFGYNYLNEVRRSFILPLWNAYSFFVTYANIDGWKPERVEGLGLSVKGGNSLNPQLSILNSLDKWILARLAETTNAVIDGLDVYEARLAALALEGFVNDLTNWYVRRSRRRFWKSEADADKNAAYATLYEVLTHLSKLLAPFTPFLAEAMWQNLTGNGALADASGVTAQGFSVHHEDYPRKREVSAEEQQLLEDVAVARTVVNLGHSLRSQSKVKVRQPLSKIVVVASDRARTAIVQQTDVICDELNVKGIAFAEKETELVNYKIMPDLKKLGPKLGQNLPKVRNGLAIIDPVTVATAVKAGTAVLIKIDSGEIVLLPDEIMVQAVPREGLLVEGSNGIVVALDPVLSELLIHEGLAREVVRRVNDQRKALNLALSDRIQINYTASMRLAQAIAAFKDYICVETLTNHLAQTESLSSTAISDEFDGETINFEIT